MLRERTEQIREATRALSIVELARLSTIVNCSLRTLMRFRAGKAIALDLLGRLDEWLEAAETPTRSSEEATGEWERWS